MKLLKTDHYYCILSLEANGKRNPVTAVIHLNTSVDKYVDN
ncbi:hypothetical protein [Flavobacterium sp. AG291]|nr:hypothetical protein [Flavobacterium sp. AG291]